jgi:hypothetical protein
MNHSKPYWQSAEEDNPQQTKLVGRAREIISCSRGNPPWMAVKHREVDVGDEGLYPGNASRMEDSLLEGPKDSLLARSLPARRLFGGTLDQRWNWSPPLGKWTTGFSETDVGRPPSAECDVGRMLDELVSSELETTRLTDDKVRADSCLTMESKGFQLCQN